MSCHIWSGRGLVEAWSRFGRASVQGSAASRTTPPQSGRYGDVTCDLLNVHTPNACTCIQPCCRTSRTPCRMSHRHAASPMLLLNFAGSINDVHPVFGVGNTRDNALPQVSQTCGFSPVCVRMCVASLLESETPQSIPGLGLMLVVVDLVLASYKNR